MRQRFTCISVCKCSGVLMLEKSSDAENNPSLKAEIFAVCHF